MARIRTIKPELGAHEGLFDLEIETGLPIRFAWCMLFTVADREGRFPWRPRTLKAQILPHDEIDFSRVLDAWITRGYIVKYRVKNEWFGVIPTFTRHQVINNREAQSELPSLEESDFIFQPLDACATRAPRDESIVADASATREVHALGEGRKEGREGDASATREAITIVPKTKPKQQIPDDFVLTDALRQQLLSRFSDADPDEMFAQFRAHHEAHGKVMKSWPAAWTTWIGNAAKFGYPKKAGDAEWCRVT